MPFSISTDSVRPAERHAYWTEAICRSFANVETRPLGSSIVSGHFEFVEIGDAKLVRFDSSPQCYRRDSRLVNTAGSDDFMFDFQTRGRSWMIQGAREGTIEPGFGVLYDARRPFEDRLDGAEHRAEVLIAAIPAASLSATFADAERSCAAPVPLSGMVSRSIMRLVRSLLRPARESSEANPSQNDIAAYIGAILRQGRGMPHRLSRSHLFPLIDIHLRENLAAAHSPATLAAGFGISERSFHRVFSDRGTTFERYILRRRVKHLRALLSQPRLSDVSIAKLAFECGFADAAHASRTFRSAFQETPRDWRASALPQSARGTRR
jgi:AraC-like DNA-binding protein